MATDTGYTGRDAADAAGITYRQLDYWARTDLIRPTLVDARGSGSRRRYSGTDVLGLRIVKSLLDVGQRLDRIRLALACLRGFDAAGLAAAFMVISPTAVLVVFDTAALVEAVLEADGVLTVLPVATLMREETAGA